MSLIRYFIILIFLSMFGSLVIAEEVKKIGKFKDWETMVLKNNSGLVCFAQTKPVLQSPKIILEKQDCLLLLDLMKKYQMK